MNEACHTYERAWSKTSMNESWRTDEWAVSHVWMRHGAHMNELCYTCEWALPKDFCEWVLVHTWMSHGAQINESCHTYERALSETSMNECHDSSICVPWLLKKSPWTESWLKYISEGATWFIWVPRLIHMCAMTPQEKSVTQSWLRCILEYATWFIWVPTWVTFSILCNYCATIQEQSSTDELMAHQFDIALIHVTWFIHTVKWHACMSAMTHWHVWHDSCMHVTCIIDCRRC